MTAAAAMEPTELEELMEAQAEAAHEREVGDATRPTAQDLAASSTRIDVEGLDLFYGDHHALKDVNPSRFATSRSPRLSVLRAAASRRCCVALTA